MAMSPVYTSHAFCWACGYDLRLLAGHQGRDVGCIVGEVPELMRGLLKDRIDPDTSDQDILRGLHALSQLNIRTSQLFSVQRRNSVEMYPLEIRKQIIEQVFALLQDWPNHFIRKVTTKGLTRASFNGQYLSLPPWIKVVVDRDLARQNRNVSKDLAERTFQRLRTELGRTPRQSDMRRVLGEAGDRYVRELVQKRTALSEDEIRLMQQRAKALRGAAQKRVDMQRAFRKAALCLNLSASSSLSLKQVAEMSASELLDQVRCTPALLEGWLWGGDVVGSDEVSDLVVGTARHLLKLSKAYVCSLMEPVGDDVLRTEEVVRLALSFSEKK
jgi:hypothetical protein